MAIIKGFLKRNHELNPTNLFGGFLLWVISAYILYAFFQLFRELLRILTIHFGEMDLLVLSPTDNYLYNLFFASVASALGYSIALRFTLQNALYKNKEKTRSLIRRTLNTEGFWTWSYLLWFGKLGSLYGILYLTLPMQYDIDLIREFPILLILLPLILIYSTWPDLNLLIRNNRTWWFLRITTIFLIMSFGFAFKNFTDYQRINTNLLKFYIPQAYDLQMPVSQSHQRIYRRAFVANIYIVKDTIESKDPVIFFDNIQNRATIKRIRLFVSRERDKLSEIERYQLIANLHIDERLSMGQITPILNELRKAELRKIQFSTGRKYSKYPPDYPVFKYSGIQKTLQPEYYPEFEKFLDSLEQVDLSGKVIKLSESDFYRNGIMKKHNRIEISLTPDAAMLNNQLLSFEELEQIVYGFIKKYSPNYAIILNTDKPVTFKRYIEYMDMLYSQVDRLRNELSIEFYKKSFDFWYQEPERDMIIRKFPVNIIEWSLEEQRLNELIKEAGRTG